MKEEAVTIIKTGRIFGFYLKLIGETAMGRKNTYENDFSYDVLERNAECIEVYDKWKSGEITQDEYIMYIINSLESYLKYRISIKHWTIKAEYEDLMAAGYEGIIYGITEKNYNPRESMPTAFFTFYIDQYMKEQVKEDGISTYYISVINSLDKIAKSYGYQDCLAPELNERRLSILSKNKYSVATVLKAISLKRTEKVSLETVSEFVEAPYSTPEKIAIKNEQSQVIAKLINENITPLELFILQKTVFEEETSVRKVVQLLNNPECVKVFGLEKKVDAKSVIKYRMRALRKLRFVDENSYLFHENEGSYIFNEQATEEEIDNAIEIIFED